MKTLEEIMESEQPEILHGTWVYSKSQTKKIAERYAREREDAILRKSKLL